MAKHTKGVAGGMVRYSAFLRRDQISRLHAVYEETGVIAAEQIRRAIDAALGIKPARHKGGGK